MGNKENDIRRTSLRIEERLAQEVKRLAKLDNGRSFNQEINIIIEKGIRIQEKAILAAKSQEN